MSNTALNPVPPGLQDYLFKYPDATLLRTVAPPGGKQAVTFKQDGFGTISAYTDAGGGSSIDLETNGTPNGDQTKLNLVAGSNITLTDDGTGDVTIDATGGGSLTAPVTIPTDSPTNVGLIIKGADGTAVSLLQSKSAATAAIGRINISFDSPVQQGSLLVLYLCLTSTFTQVPSSISDDLGNTYTLQVNDGGDPNNYDYSIYTCTSIASGANSLAIFISSPATGAVAIHEFNGVTNVDNVPGGDFGGSEPPVNPLIGFDDVISGEVLQFVGLNTNINTTFTANGSGGGGTPGGALAEQVSGSNLSIATFWLSGGAGTYSPSYNVTDTSGTWALYGVIYMNLIMNQSADLQEWQSTSGSVLSSVNGAGQFVQAQTSGAPATTPALGTTAFDPATNKLWVFGSAGWKSTTLS